MLKLYLKAILTVIILSFAVLSINHFGYSYFTTKGFNQINKTLAQGTFSYIQTLLAKTPPSNWPSTLEKIQPKNQPKVKIIPIKILNLSDKNRAALLNGKIIITAGSGEKAKQRYFLYYGLIETFALQRISNSTFALQLMITEPINHTIKDTMAWITHITLLKLNKTPKSQWPVALKELQAHFNIPLQVIPANGGAITNSIQNELETYGVAYQKPENKNFISTLYFYTPDPKKILVVGPIQYREVSNLFVVEQRYYFIILFIAALIVVIFLTWAFSRNVNKIYQITQSYSKGKFDQNIKIRPVSILRGVYDNVTNMGRKLKHLIQSQQNMTRFVAHEVRTPLSTMQLAIDSLKKESGLSQAALQNLVSIQEDIESINKLIGYFLLYYKTNTNDLKLNTESANLTAWAKTVTSKYKKLSTIKMTFSQQHKNNLITTFDPNLLKHALDNLMTNALKFAKNNICVSLDTDNHYIQIHVDDDGPGIPTAEANNIFEAFSTLDDNNTLGKHIGLGLSIAKSIVELHHGSLTVTQAPELGGARLTISIPI